MANLEEISASGINNNFTALNTTKADLNGNSTETFEVADATTSTEAVNKRQLDTAVAAIESELETKANVSLDNIDSDAESLISNLGMPSDSYIDLTLGASGSTYTAPANGYFNIYKMPTGSVEYLKIVAPSYSICDYAAANGQGLAFLIPAKTNDVIQIDYTFGGITPFFRFIYAEGEV